MRSDAAQFELRGPATLTEALTLLSESPGAVRPLAGGTDLMVLFASGKLDGPGKARRFVNLWGLKELQGIQVTEGEITLGALTTYRDVQGHEVVRTELPMLVQAASETGGWAIQNRGTLGGNIANASPAADSPPALLAYDASLDLVSARGTRTVRYAQFHTGYKTTVMAPDELILRVRVPRAPAEERSRRLHLYRKVGPRKAQAISKVCFAACIEAGAVGPHRGRGAVRIALGGVAPVTLRCPQTEALVGRAIAGGFRPEDVTAARNALSAEIAPIDDIRSNAAYRRAVAVNLLEELLAEVQGGART